MLHGFSSISSIDPINSVDHVQAPCTRAAAQPPFLGVCHAMRTTADQPRPRQKTAGIEYIVSTDLIESAELTESVYIQNIHNI